LWIPRAWCGHSGHSALDGSFQLAATISFVK
jgi:hypothetical protein